MVWLLPRESTNRTTERTGVVALATAGSVEPDRWHHGRVLGRASTGAARRELAELDAFRHVRRAADEDVTRFGEELTGLHLDTLGADLDDAMRADYQRALDAYEDAKAALARATVRRRRHRRDDARWPTAASPTRACSPPRPGPPGRSGATPASSTPPTAPPAATSRGRRRAAWPARCRSASATPSGSPRGDQPETRLVRLGDRRVAWFASGPLYAAWAAAGTPSWSGTGRMEADRLTMAYAGTLPGPGGAQLPVAAAWIDPGAWSDGGMIGGHDYSGWGGGGSGAAGSGTGAVQGAAQVTAAEAAGTAADPPAVRRRACRLPPCSGDAGGAVTSRAGRGSTAGASAPQADGRGRHRPGRAGGRAPRRHPGRRPRPDRGDHYRRALEHYEQAKQLLAASRTAEDVVAVEQVVADARYHRAAVLAVLAGDPLPERREPCFFNPQHGPSMQDVEWTPPGGTARVVAVCAADARRLAAGDEPLVRMVRVGDRWVPWHLAAGTDGTGRAPARELAPGDEWGGEVQKGLAQAYLNQSTGGAGQRRRRPRQALTDCPDRL